MMEEAPPFAVRIIVSASTAQWWKDHATGVRVDDLHTTRCPLPVPVEVDSSMVDWLIRVRYNRGPDKWIAIERTP